jgi:transcription elongation factor Elf1
MTRLFKCSKCETGVVKLKVSKKSGSITMKTIACNNCRESYGFKGLTFLEEIEQPISQK